MERHGFLAQIQYIKVFLAFTVKLFLAVSCSWNSQAWRHGLWKCHKHGVIVHDRGWWRVMQLDAEHKCHLLKMFDGVKGNVFKRATEKHITNNAFVICSLCSWPEEQ